MFDRIVVGTDGSETATAAVKTAVELARLSGAKLEIVSAYQPIPQSRLREEESGISGDISHTINPREDVQLVLGNAAAEAKKANVDVVTHPREGDPADAILDVAADGYEAADRSGSGRQRHAGAAGDRPAAGFLIGRSSGHRAHSPAPLRMALVGDG